jgi:hypothetical protein
MYRPMLLSWPSLGMHTIQTPIQIPQNERRLSVVDVERTQYTEYANADDNKPLMAVCRNISNRLL